MIKVLDCFSQKQKRIIISCYIILLIFVSIVTWNDWPTTIEDVQIGIWLSFNVLYWLIIWLLNWIKSAENK
jgi:hypothetical protein